MGILELRDVTHLYSGRKVIDIPSLTIEKGGIYCLVGPNGSGKTTLLSVMSLIMAPTKGQVYFEGRQVNYDADTLKTLRRSMTMVFQNPYLFTMSVGKNVGYGLKARGLPKKISDARIRDALSMVGLEGFEKRKAKELSGGEIQLVAIARALALEPSILFLDEPTANVDSRHVQRFEGIISRVNKGHGTTIVMTTHNLAQAYRISDRVLSLFEGSLVASVMHNLFSGRYIVTEEGPCVDTGEIRVWVSFDHNNTTERLHVTIDPEDIIVSKEPFASSARNLFKGTIIKVIEQGGRIFLEVESKEIFKVMITERSLSEMGLNVGTNVFLTFKASSVKPL